MADFGGFNITTPQEVEAQLAQQRRAVMVGGNVQQQRSQNIETALDTLFGNPQLNLAKKLNSRVQSATANLQPMEGESDLDSELRRLKAIRDSVKDLSPETASQVNTQILKLGQMRLEQNKLVAEERRADSKDQREAGAFPLEQVSKAQGIQKAQSEGQNYLDPKTGKVQNVAELDSLERARLRKEGWVEVNLSVQGQKPDDLGLTKPVTTDLQKTLIDSQQQLDGLFSIAQKYDPSFTQLPTQAMNAGRDFYERLGGTLSPDQAGKLQAYSEFKRNSVDSFNRYIKFITGAAMSNKEADRIQKGFPDPDGDGSTKFMAKLRETVKQTLGVQKRAQDALKSGLRISGDQWDKIEMPPVSDTEVDQFLNQRLGVPLPQRSAPAADGWQDLGNGVRIRKK